MRRIHCALIFAILGLSISEKSFGQSELPMSFTTMLPRSNNPYEQMLANEGLRKQLGIDNKKYEKILAVFSTASSDTRLSRSKLVELSKVPLAEREQVLVGLRDSVTKSNEKITAYIKAILSKEEFTRLEEAKLQMQLMVTELFLAHDVTAFCHLHDAVRQKFPGDRSA